MTTSRQKKADQQAPHPYVWMSKSHALPTGLGIESESLELPLESLPEWEDSKVKVYPVVCPDPSRSPLALSLSPASNIINMSLPVLAICPVRSLHLHHPVPLSGSRLTTSVLEKPSNWQPSRSSPSLRRNGTSHRSLTSRKQQRRRTLPRRRSCERLERGSGDIVQDSKTGASTSIPARVSPADGVPGHRTRCTAQHFFRVKKMRLTWA